MAGESIRAKAERELALHEREIARHEQEIAKHRSEATELRAFLSVWDKLAPEKDSPDPSTPEDNAGIAREGLSQFEGFKITLRIHGKPLGATDGAKRMLAMGYQYNGDVKTLAASLRGVLSRYHEDDPEIEKISRGTYGLTEWRHRGNGTADFWDDNEGAPASDSADTGAEPQHREVKDAPSVAN